MTPGEARDAFIEASFWHGSLERSDALLAAYPEVARSDVHTAAIVGDEEAVRRFLAADPAQATAKGGPRGVDALTHLCFSNYLRLDPARSPSFVRAATALLDAGASARTGFWQRYDDREPEWESVIYGAAGVAHHPELTRVLLERGADPNDEETPYHAPETFDNRALEVLVESGLLTDDSLTMILLRKTDWHDHEAIKWLLSRGVDPNRTNRFGKTALLNALLSDNHLAIIKTLLDHGADPRIAMRQPDRYRTAESGQSAVVIAARRGRGDVLQLLEQRGFDTTLHGVDRLIAACARNDRDAIRSITAEEPGGVQELLNVSGTILGQFATTGNTLGIRRLLDLGVDPRTPYEQGNSYLGIARHSTALHAASWLAWHDTVRFLIDRGAPVDVRDGDGRTPLFLAVRACVDSYWTYRRAPDSVDALLKAGASVADVKFPSGYDAVDDLLRAHGATSSLPQA